MKITLDLPDTVVEKLLAAASAAGSDMNNYTVVKLQQILATEDFAEEDAEADDDLIAALREGIADRDSGNLRTLDQVEESVRAALAARHQKAAA